jgi:hypothetical protein
MYRWLLVAFCFAYLCWIGWNWLALPLSGQELAGSAGRVWDVKRELMENGKVPWWTPYYMSGSSYGINHARGLYLVPWILLSSVFDLMTAGKVMMLLGMGAGSIGMFYCARYFLKDQWASMLAAVVYLVHPMQLVRAGWTEHVTISLFMAFVPWLWLTLARALDSGKARDMAVCALVAVGAFWADNKQAVIMGVFLACYAVMRCVMAWRTNVRAQTESSPAMGTRTAGSVARAAAVVAIFAGALGAGLIVPGWMESRHVKLFEGEPMEQWQQGFAFKSFLGLMDRDGVVTTGAAEGIRRHARATGFQDVPIEDRGTMQERINRVGGLRADAPEKYAGLVLLALVVAAALFNRQRVNRPAFWFFVGMLMLSVMLATGPSTVLGANGRSMAAIFWLPGIPVLSKLAVLVALGVVAWGLVRLFRHKARSDAQLVWTLSVLGVFLALPAFDLVSKLPFFNDIRAPYAFYDVPSVMFLAMLAGFFVTDTVATGKWAGKIPHVVAGVAVLMVVDYWPYQRPMKMERLPANAEANLRAAYEAVGKDAGWSKCFAFSGRYYHLLGPVWSGKPQTDEAFYNWMSPVGMGLLNRVKWTPITQLLSFLQMMNVSHIVFDKIDPGLPLESAVSLLERLRKTYPEVVHENDHFIVLRNDTANAYVTAFNQACLYLGDYKRSAPLALALGPRSYPLLQSSVSTMVSDIEFDKLDGIQAVYATGDNILHLKLVPKEWQSRVFSWVTDAPPAFPKTNGSIVPLADLNVRRAHAGRIEIRAGADIDCWLVIAESWFPYWRAELDGQPVELHRMNCGMMAVRMTAGIHQVTLIYEIPRAYKVAGIVSALAFLAGLAMMWRRSA